MLGYSAQIAVSNDHLIVAQRVIRRGNDNASLVPMVKLVQQTCGSPPERVVADSGFYSNQNVELLDEQGVDAYVPDSNLARELNLGHPARETPNCTIATGLRSTSCNASRMPWRATTGRWPSSRTVPMPISTAAMS